MPNFDSRTTRMPGGLTNATPHATMSAAGLPDPSFAHVYHNDFDTYAAGDWTVSVTGSGTQALTDADGGALLLTTTTGASDCIYMQLVNAGFALKAGCFTFFKFSATLSDVSGDTFYAGLIQKSATTLASITDGVFISKAPGGAALTLNVRKASAAVTVALPTVCIPVNATQFELGIVVDYLGNVAAFFNPGTGRSVPMTAAIAAVTGRGRVASLTTPALPTVNLTPAFGILNASGAARTLQVDYLTVARER